MKIKSTLVIVLLAVFTAIPAAWHRSRAELFAVLPARATGPEGLAVGPDGNVYVATFGFNAQGPATGLGQLYVYAPTATSSARFRSRTPALTCLGSTSTPLPGRCW